MDSKLLMTAAILAGGKNKRFGGEIKSLQLFNGETIIAHQLNILEELFAEVIIIANEKNAFQEYSAFNIYSDIFRERGPLAGIHSALKHATHKDVFIVAGDMPFLTKNAISNQAKIHLEEKADALIPKHIKGIEPLHGFYSQKILSGLEKLLAGSNNSVNHLLKTINTSYWNVNELIDFVNINTHEELRKYID